MYQLQILTNYSVYFYIHLPLEYSKISLHHVASEKTYSDSNEADSHEQTNKGECLLVQLL